MLYLVFINLKWSKSNPKKLSSQFQSVKSCKTYKIIVTPLQFPKKIVLLHPLFAQMAELVDALVSNTSGFTSIPVRSRVWVLRKQNPN
jgi:hypothetical protein